MQWAALDSVAAAPPLRLVVTVIFEDALANTEGRRKVKDMRSRHAPVAGPAAVEHRRFTFDVGQITEPKHVPSIGNGSQLTG